MEKHIHIISRTAESGFKILFVCYPLICFYEQHKPKNHIIFYQTAYHICQWIGKHIIVAIVLWMMELLAAVTLQM